MEIQENIKLSDYTTFKIGGNARYFVIVENEDELKEAVNFAERNSLPLYILGGGSNLLVSDDGVDGLVVKMEIKGIEFQETNFASQNSSSEKIMSGVSFTPQSEVEGCVRHPANNFQSNPKTIQVTAGAGEIWDDLVKQCVEKDLYGIENLSHIPGTVGASVVQNIGAYGVEVKDVVGWVEVFDTETKEIKKLTGKACQFDYRDSIFKKSEGKNFVVLRIALDLKKDGKLNTSYKDFKNHSNPVTVKEVRDIVIDIRKNKLPDWKVVGTAGSFFKNPIVTKEQLEKIQKDFPEISNYDLGDGKFKISLAYLLDKLGWKEKKEGYIGVYENQPLALVNYGESTAKDIKNFAEKITKEVKEKIGLDIDKEVVEW